MLAKMFPGAMEASFHRSDTGAENLGDLGVTATFLDQREERAILRPKLREGVP